jgi:small-conductance mechanosensitive channel
VRNGRQADLSARVGRIRRGARPWKSLISLLLAVAAAVLSGRARRGSLFAGTALAHELAADGAAALFCLFGSMVTYGLAGQSRQVLEPRAGRAHSAVVRYAILIVGAFATLVITLELFTVPVGELVLGGALTSVFVGIAAQQALGNVFAGLVLQLARPFRVGDAIRLQAGALGGQLDGTVTDIGITYLRFEAGGGVMSIPNSQVLNAVVGPIPPGEGGATSAAPDTAAPDTAGPQQPGPPGPP